MRYQVEANLPIDCRTYFVERDAASFRSLLAKTLSLGEYEFVEAWSEGPVKFVKLKTKPDFSAWVPKSAAGALPLTDLEFFDIIKYDPAELEHPPYRLHTNIHSTLTIEEMGPNKTRQVLEGEIKVKVFGLGGLAERMVKSSLERTYKRLPEVVERWVEFREEVLRQPGGNQRLLLGRPSLSTIPWISEDVKTRLQASQERPSQKRSLQDSRLPSFGSARRKRSQHPKPGLDGNTSGSQARRERISQTGGAGVEQAQEAQKGQQAAQQKPVQKQDQHPASQTTAGGAAQQRSIVDGSSRASPLHSQGASGQGSASESRAAHQPQHEQQEASPSVAVGLPPSSHETARTAEPSDSTGKGGAQASPFAKAAAGGCMEPRMVAADAMGQGASHTDGSWSRFNADAQDWGRYWSKMGVQPLPGSGFISPGLVRLGSFSYRVGLLRPVVIPAGGGTITRAAWTAESNGDRKELAVTAPAERGMGGTDLQGPSTPAQLPQEYVGRWGGSMGGSSAAGHDLGSSQAYGSSRDGSVAAVRGSSMSTAEALSDAGGRCGGSSAGGRQHPGSSQAYESSRDGSVVAARGSVTSPEALSEEEEEEDGASVAASASTTPTPGLAVVPYQQEQQAGRGRNKQRQRLSGSTSKRLLRKLLCAS
ncbi:hypothetical protein N2152v2_010956 [Parachlorella kessleri]